MHVPPRQGDEAAGEPAVRVLLVCPDGCEGPNPDALRDLLRRCGHHEIMSAADLATAQATIADQAPEVILLDAALLSAAAPERDLRALAAGTAKPRLAVLACAPDTAARARWLAVGADDVIAHPFDPVDLVNRVRLHAETGREARRLAARMARLERAVDLLGAAERRLSAQLGAAEARSVRAAEFVAQISHEFRNPLNAICGFAEMMAAEMFGPLGHPRYQAHARNIHHAAQHLIGVVNNLLDLAKAEAGELAVHPEQVEVEGLIRNTLDLLAPQAEAAGVTLAAEIAADLPVIESDRGKLRQILINLVANALRFTPAGGRVRVQARRDDAAGVLVLVVSDTGIGIAPEDLARIMQPYKQARRAGAQGQAAPRSGMGSGTGLGLPITKRLVELLGGSMAIESALGAGTSVSVRLPLRCPGAPAGSTPPPRRRPPAETGLPETGLPVTRPSF